MALRVIRKPNYRRVVNGKEEVVAYFYSSKYPTIRYYNNKYVVTFISKKGIKATIIVDRRIKDGEFYKLEEVNHYDNVLIGKEVKKWVLTLFRYNIDEMEAKWIFNKVRELAQKIIKGELPAPIVS